MTSMERLLAQLGAQVQLAKEALADEREGDLTRAVVLIDQDAGELFRIVKYW